MIDTMRSAFFAIPAFLALPLLCLAQTPPSISDGDPIATIGGQPVYERDLAPLIAPQLRQLRNQEYQIKSRALDNLIGQRVLETEAKKRGLTADKLLEQEVDSKIGEPTEGEIEGYYLAQRERIGRPLAEVHSQVEQAVKEAKLQKARQEYMNALREKAGVEILLRPLKTEVAYDPARVKGDPSAPITIVEFSDFQCPFCRRVEPTLTELLAKYKGRVKLAYRDFPLREAHPQAEIAAEGARCAGDQGKFWEFHDVLFSNPSKLDENSLVEHARALGLDEKQFRTCLSSGKFKNQVEADLQDGARAGVAGTPGFFINGASLEGAQPLAAFEKIIESELAAGGRRP